MWFYFPFFAGHVLLLSKIGILRAVVIVGAMMKLEFVWNFSDMMNGMMAIPNIVGLLLLSKVVKVETERYFKW